MKLFRLDFIPRSTDCGLLVLRVWFGVSMLALHGWGKLTGFSAIAPKFADPFGLGSTVSLALVVVAEFLGAGMIALGLFTRMAALVQGFSMGVAFTVAHGSALTGARSGEMAFLYLGACVVLVIAGGGRFSLDARLGGKS